MIVFGAYFSAACKSLVRRLGTPAAAAAFVAGAVLACLGPVRADNELAVARPTFYVIAPGGDSSIAPIVSAVVTRLQALFDKAAGTGSIWVIPRLTWGPDDLYQQCANDPTKSAPGGPRVLGGMILDGTNSYTSATASYILLARGWVKASTRAEIVSCAPVGFGTPTITWTSGDVSGYSARNGFPIVTGGATALYLGSKVNSDARYIALGASISGLDSTTSIPPVDSADEMHTAAGRVANDLLEKLGTDCATNVDLRLVCIKLGLPAAPAPAATPVASPSPASTQKPSGKSAKKPAPKPAAKPTPFER